MKILDLCCYVGQWSKNLATHLESLGCKVELVCADASQKALDSCLKNLESLANTKVTAMKADVMQDLSSLASATFDIVVCDPPALIKSRKHRQAGERAYEKLNHQALRLVRSGGWLISCSCSGLMEEQKFLEVIASVANAHRIHLRVLARGSQASDHPQLAEFPEGSYLKAFIAKSST